MGDQWNVSFEQYIFGPLSLVIVSWVLLTLVEPACIGKLYIGPIVSWTRDIVVWSVTRQISKRCMDRENIIFQSQRAICVTESASERGMMRPDLNELRS